MSKRRATQMENDMMNETNTLDPLAELGLDVSDAPTEGETEAQETEVARSTSNDDDIEFGEIEIGTATEIPTTTRAGGGSRFPFDKLTAPVTDPKTKAVTYSQFMVPYKSGDQKKFSRSVQSATTQANRNTDGKYFISRSIKSGSDFKGIAVYRTDERPEEEAAAE